MISHISPAASLARRDEMMTGALPAWLRGVLAAVIVAGLALRVVCPGTTAFYRDQAYACALAEDVVAGHWQTAGLSNSGGFRNLPGFVYLMAAVWWLRSDPLALLSFVGAVNILAVLLSGYLVRRWVGPAAAWWTTAFLAASPWAIHYSRWIWAQHLLFPAALMVFLFLRQWLGRGRRWAVLGVILSLALVVQIHLAGLALALAVGLLLLWRRPRVPFWPTLIGVAIAAGSVLPYLLDGHLAWPEGNRIGYRHFWRVFPGGMMSVTGLGWQLEFRKGYPAFAQSFGWRLSAYYGLMVLPVGLFGVAVTMGLKRIWRRRREGSARRWDPVSTAAALVVLIPASFILMGLRTSPTYLPVWYPLPFLLMGWAAVRLMRRAGGRRRRWVAPVLLVALCAQLIFFVDQLRYIHVNGGVPGSPVGRSYAGVQADVADLAGRIDAREVWLLYEGPSVMQDTPAPYLLRRANWAGSKPGRAVVHFRWWGRPYDKAGVIEYLPPGADPPGGAYLVRPWTHPMQAAGKIQLRPARPTGRVNSPQDR